MPYELYKQKLLAWREVTDLSKDKLGVAIALSLPEEDKNKIQEKGFNEIGFDKLKQDDGVDTLIQFLDGILLKDELRDSLEKMEEFEAFQRANGQSIAEYISTFDSMYRKIEKLDMKLPSHILAFKLLRKANIGQEEKMFVLTGMNYANKKHFMMRHFMIPWYGPSPFSLICSLLLKDLILFLFPITAAGVVPCGGPKKPPRTSSIVQIIFSFWSFDISEGILRNQKIRKLLSV